MKLLEPERVDTIVIHISDSYYGNVEVIDNWHKDNGWIMIGYHHLITNCYPKYVNWVAKKPMCEMDGVIHEGRPEEFQGAHVKGHNNHSIGVCLVGKLGQFTSKQLKTAVDACLDIRDRFTGIKFIKGHYELDKSKSCPDIDMPYFRDLYNKAKSGEDICHML